MFFLFKRRKESCNATPSYVLGSSGSILELSKRQKKYLSEHPYVFGMNKFLLYWNKAEISPSYYFLADTHFPSYVVFQRTIEKLDSLPRRPTLCLDRAYKPFLTTNVLPEERENAEKQISEWKENHPDCPFRLFNIDDSDVVYFFRKDRFSKPNRFEWAKRLDQPLYFWRSSLTMLINLIAIIRPNAPIVLVGIDLNRRDYFFQEEFESETLLHDHTVGRSKDLHATAAKLGKRPGIHERWPFINKMCAKKGISIYNANSNSLLVEQGYVQFMNVPSR